MLFFSFPYLQMKRHILNKTTLPICCGPWLLCNLDSFCLRICQWCLVIMMFFQFLEVLKLFFNQDSVYVIYSAYNILLASLLLRALFLKISYLEKLYLILLSTHLFPIPHTLSQVPFHNLSNHHLFFLALIATYYHTCCVCFTFSCFNKTISSWVERICFDHCFITYLALCLTHCTVEFFFKINICKWIIPFF